MKRFFIDANEGSTSLWPAAWAVCRAELVLRRRDSRLSVLLAVLAGVCLLLTPAADAPYAVLTLGGLKPLMSVDTRVLVAAVVLNLLLLPCFLLIMHAGHTRDQRLGMEKVIATSPLPSSLVVAARMVANAFLAIGICGLLLVLICFAVAMREKQVPELAATGGFLLLTLPPALLSISIGAALDHWIGHRLLLKALAAFALVGLFVAAAASSVLDVFGLQLLMSHLPDAAGTSGFAIGFVSAPQGTGVGWSIGALGWSFVSLRLAVIFGAFGFAGLISRLAGFRASITVAMGEAFNEDAPVTSLRVLQLRRHQPTQPNALRVAVMLMWRWYSPLTLGVAVVAFGVALFDPHSPRYAPVVALLIPLLIANGDHLRSDGRRGLELSGPTFWLPSPTLFTGLVLTSSVALPLIPVFLFSSLVTSLHLLAGIGASSLWLAWASIQLGRPLLAISTYVLLWYVESSSTVPNSVDFLGLQGSTGPAFLISAAALIVLAVLCWRGDRVGKEAATLSRSALGIALRKSL